MISVPIDSDPAVTPTLSRTVLDARPDLALLRAIVLRIDMVLERLEVAAVPDTAPIAVRAQPVAGSEDLVDAVNSLITAFKDRRPAEASAERLSFRADELAAALGISRRALDRERAAGRFPKADKILGKMPIWSKATVQKWLEGAKKP